MSNSLGDNAFCKNITATNYQQPFKQYGTLISPIISGLIYGASYVDGINKYIIFLQAPASTVAINHEIILNNPVLPADYPSTHTTTGSVEWVLTGPTAGGPPTLPLIITTMSVINDTLAPALGTSYVFAINSPVPPIYPVGNNAVLKIVININAD